MGGVDERCQMTEASETDETEEAKATSLDINPRHKKLEIHPCIHKSMRPCIHPSSPSIDLSIHPSIHPSVHPSIHTYILKCRHT